MRALEETLARWQATSVADLQRAVKENGPASPCLSGCRSVCWKTFLLVKDASQADLARVLGRGRDEFGRRKSRLFEFIHHPEALARLTIDPLADDPESPWNTARRDEIVRQEIRQDVQRLPDEADYHQDRMQSMILDILFVYCKTHPDRGGYRQGMHELLAPIVHVVEQDAVDRAAVVADSSLDQSMLDILDSAYVEHDAYLLFSCLMERAHSFYEVRNASDGPAASRVEPATQESRSAIVERSRHIHEVCLASVDPELSSHLLAIEILPQIFLIRWIRLLFSREFPLDQTLTLWDTIFAVDPSLDLVDLVCCAMLIRIRHRLLEADYSACLQLLLKYLPPTAPHGPRTFIDDALYLRDHPNVAGRDALLVKYTGKTPETSRARPSTPNAQGSSSLGPRGFGSKSPLPSPSRFMAQQSGMESLFQGAAKSVKGVLERGEKLGLNQAVRDAVGEFLRNMQASSEPRPWAGAPKRMTGEEGAAAALVALERRNKQLAALLDETVVKLRAAATSRLDDEAQRLDLIQVAAAKIQFVQVYLSDSSLEMPRVDGGSDKEARADSDKEADVDAAKGEAEDGERTSGREAGADQSSPSRTAHGTGQDSDAHESKAAPPTWDECEGRRPAAEQAAGVDGSPETARPAAPMPTRSALAQSSFSWMLEPGESAASRRPAGASQNPAPQHKKRSSSNASRERNAFLFGDVAADARIKDAPNGDEMFGLETIRRP